MCSFPALKRSLERLRRVLGHNPPSGHNQRDSNYITHHNHTYFHGNQFPQAVWRNGTSLNSPFDLAPITEFMVVRLQVNDNAPIPYSSYQIGRSTGLQCNLDISEILAFTPALSNEEASKMNAYLAKVNSAILFKHPS